jgi:hypothetical protein
VGRVTSDEDEMMTPEPGVVGVTPPPWESGASAAPSLEVAGLTVPPMSTRADAFAEKIPLQPKVSTAYSPHGPAVPLGPLDQNDEVDLPADLLEDIRTAIGGMMMQGLCVEFSGVLGRRPTDDDLDQLFTVSAAVAASLQDIL